MRGRVSAPLIVAAKARAILTTMTIKDTVAVAV